MRIGIISKTLSAPSQSPDRFQTTDNERDAETGLDYRMARYYDAEYGRFLAVDPLAGQFPGWSPISGTYSVTTHGAIYFGASLDNTQYFWSKNGKYDPPGVFTLAELQSLYGKVEGYRKEPGGGFYNRK